MSLDEKKKIKKEKSAGGIVFKVTKQGPLIAMMLDPYYKWGFPKGHIEKGETAEEAAVAETQEELGLSNLKVVAPIDVTEIRFLERFRLGKPVSNPNSIIHKTIEFFLLKATPDAVAHPQKEEFIHDVEWVTPDEARERLKYKNMVSLLEKAISMIEDSLK
ncbi:MAG: hypothetical protein UT32_C0049G0001 [Parcubacteria group bacterium GW2011_GWC2_39_14]|nr:MAG: hypothetical protein UT32_C0049G0001 [Parcubacteria group bacterium GW2011_GWC2_39_14]